MDEASLCLFGLTTEGRPQDEGWIWVTTPAEAIALLESGHVDRLSLDYDLGIFEGDREVTGNELVLWLEEAVVLRGMTPPSSISLHSANPLAHEKMQKGIDAITFIESGGYPA